jgi:hypothetical protein
MKLEAEPTCTEGVAWSNAGNLLTWRILHTATLLSDSSVLIAGGHSRSAERFDPNSGVWTPAGTSLHYRRYHSATRMADGRVLLAGGAEGEPAISAEVYDPTSNSWAATGSMAAPRRDHSSTLLRDGSILVAGGSNNPDAPSAERYDPASGSWTPTGPMKTPRRGHTATPLPDGRVLILGGEDPHGNRLASAEVYAPSTGAWINVPGMSQPRILHSATALADGSVLVVGGAPGGAAATAEVYNPATGTWISTGSMLHPRRNHTATRLADGSVLVAGGYNESSGILSAVERYTPATGSWCQAPRLAVARYGHTATVLDNGRVLVAAGFSNINQSSAELYGPPAGCDSLPPQLTLSSPPEGFITREPLLTLTGSVDDPSCTVTLNGTPVPLTGLAYTGHVSLTEGTNTLQVSAEDVCHNRATLVRHVRLDSTAPSVAFLQPTPGSVLHQPFVEVLLTYADESSGIDPTSFKLLLDGVDLSDVLTYSASSAYGTVPLTQGSHTLVARVSDQAGNLSQTQVQVTAELPQLFVTLTKPVTGTSFTAPASIHLAATASSAAGSITRVEFLRDGVVVGAASSAPYEVWLSDIPAGTYALRARAVDDRGGSGVSAPVTITVNPLALTLTSPLPDTLVIEGVLVTGTFQAPSGSGVTVNGVPAVLTGNTFQLRVPVEPGAPRTLTATLTAPEGQSLSRSVTVMASPNSSPAGVEIIPSSGFAPLQVGFKITNRLDQPLSFMFGSSGPFALPGGAEASLALTYPAGVHVANITFMDGSGRSTQQSFVIEAIDQNALDQQLRAMWSAMNDALVAGDKERALTFLSASAQAKYGPVFDQLLPDMPSIVDSYSPLHGASLSMNLGEYAINRTLDGVNRVFFISFVRDPSGAWHLDAM